MYLLLDVIPNVNLDKNQITIVKHINGRLNALSALETECRNFIQNEVGKLNNGAEIISVSTFDSIKKSTPIMDGIHMYRLNDDPDKIYLFKKSTKISVGWISNGIESTFDLIKYYQLIMYEGLQNIPTREEKQELITVNGSIKIPKSATVVPFIDMIAELKKSEFFLGRNKLLAKSANSV